MRRFLRLIIRNPLAVLLGAAVVLLVGVNAAWHLPVDLFPDLEVPVVNIISHYSGAAPQDMELLVTRPLEDQMRGLQGVKRVASTSVQGISQVTVEFVWGTSLGDARQLVQAGLARARELLPAKVEPRLESISTTLQEVVGFVVYGAGDPISLRTSVRLDIANRLLGVPGVSSMEVLGGDQPAFNVVLTPARLGRLNLTASDIVQNLQNGNLTSAAGYLERSAREYPIRGDARLRTLEDLRSLPIPLPNGRSVPLGSIASIDSGRLPRHYTLHGDGIPAVAFVVLKQPGVSTIRVVHGVETALSEVRQFLPPGTQVKKFYDQSEIVAEARSEIYRDLAVGALLVVGILYLFLGAFRPTLVVAATIPMTLLAALALMHLFGIGLNVVTMAALTLSVGMIVDDAVVVAENIYRHRQLGRKGESGSLAGALEIAGPDASGTFTTVAAFLPLLLVTGLAGLFLRPFGFTLSAALLVSLALSLTFIPALFAGRWGTATARDFAGRRLLARIDRTLQRTLRAAFRHRRLTLAVAVLSLTLAGLAAFLGKASLLPPIDEGALLIEYIMPPGTALSESDRIGDALDHLAMAQPGVATVYRRTGSPELGYQIEGVNRGEITIKLQPRGERRSGEEIMAELKHAYAEIPGLVFLFHQPTQEKIDESFSGLPALFGVTVFGPDLDILATLAGEAEEIMSRESALSNIINNAKVQAPEIRVRLNSPALERYRVDAADVLTALEAARSGVEATRIAGEREEISVLVRLATSREDTFAALGDLPVNSAGGGMLPLRQVAEVAVEHSPATVTRLNGERQITLLAEAEGNLPAVASRLHDRLRAHSWPAGYRVEITGQYPVLMQTLREMAFVVLGACLLIYLIMTLQFRSGLQPLLILVTVPLSLVGAVMALFITRQGLDVSVGMGLVTLIGVAVNNAIVLLDYANRQQVAGLSLEDALLRAASVRLRPILMTALSTVFALIPVAIGTTAGSQTFQPFAITVIGGMCTGTLATLIVIPVLASYVPRHPAENRRSLQ